MILFFNVFITDVHAKGVAAYQNREMAKSFDKLDIYKYSLASLANIYPWKKVILNTKLDENYSHRRGELNNFIKEEFGKYDLLIRNYRNETQEQWQSDYELLDDNLIWFSGNHDHVFIDNDYKYFYDFIDIFKNEDDMFSIQFSHWQELLYDPFFFNIQASFHDKYIELFGKYHHSLHIISKKLYEYYWFETKLPKDQIWGRVDNFFVDAFSKKIKTFVAHKELCRHFDGYQHCALPYPNNIVPVLEIPDGFFEKEIKINYSNVYKQGYTNINPKSQSLKIFDTNGFDYWYSKKFIPKFWNSKIVEFSEDFLLKEDMTLNDLFVMKQLQFINIIPDYNLKTKILNSYMN